MTKIIKAVIPAAGMGTRLLPATKAIPKEMLPIVNIPTIQLIVEEAIKSGITEILIIVSNTKNSIIDHFDSNYELEDRLTKKNKIDALKEVKLPETPVSIFFVRQHEPEGLGHAIGCAKSFIGNEPFAVLLGDDVISTEKNEETALKQCMEAYYKTNCSIVGVQEVPDKSISKYGIIEPLDRKNKTNPIQLKGMIEKPSLDEAPSNFAILGRYILTPDIFEAIKNTKRDKSGEIQITDAIKLLMQEKNVYACNFTGRRYDLGNKFGMVEATVENALKDKEISNQVQDMINRLAK